MSLLHVYFVNRKQQAFRRLLDQGSSQGSKGHTSSSGGKSWSRLSPLSSTQLDVNARDWLGRTVLHLAASATDASASEYVRMLLAHPSININIQDRESHWTALHRALYHGNLATTILLLRRPDIDTDLKDFEGYRALDLYNSTVQGTKPEVMSPSGKVDERLDLFTWGSNRNATLGLGDADDRTFPDQVLISRPDTSFIDSVDSRFNPVRVCEIAMSKLHTVILTTEPRGNMLACGFGSGGRLGPTSHTQYNLLHIASTLPPSTVVTSIALGQDHTLALTSSGEVYSWGLNRFCQLGYAVESTVSGATKEEIQATPRKVPGLRHKIVMGVAACRTASALWTRDEVWTWGTNNGQLGYDKSAQPIQVAPRKVSKVTQPVLGIAITDVAMVCLLETNDVVCIWNDMYTKVNFSSPAFPSEIIAYRPPHAVRNTSIHKVTSCDSTFAALSTNGEVFTFSFPSPGESTNREGINVLVKPQRVWALRKQFSAVKDVELGSDGSIIICTESGHVFIRSRNLRSTTYSSSSLLGKPNTGIPKSTFKFHRVSFLQRVIKVSANSTGSYGAIRLDAEPGNLEIASVGALVQEDLKKIIPYLGVEVTAIEAWLNSSSGNHERALSSMLPPSPLEMDGGDAEDFRIFEDVRRINTLCDRLENRTNSLQVAHLSGELMGLPDPSCRLPYGADILILVPSPPGFAAHRLILAARCPTLNKVLLGDYVVADTQSNITIKYIPSPGPLTRPLQGVRGELVFEHVHPFSILILLEFLYSDEVLAIWDPRITASLCLRFTSLGVTPAGVKEELLRLAAMLELSSLRRSVEAPVKRFPHPTMVRDLSRLVVDDSVPVAELIGTNAPLTPDIVLVLGDRDVPCHSTVLRSRTDFFTAFFGSEDWTKNRWTTEGTIRVDLKHLRWDVMKFVVQYIYGGDIELFDRLEFVKTSEELVEFMVQIMAAADELLLDRLIQLCSAVVLKRLTIWNACSILTDATHFRSVHLMRHTQRYIVRNLETMLEGHMLDDLPTELVKQLSVFIRSEQLEKSPTLRSGKLVTKAIEEFKDWLALQDIPEPIERKPSEMGIRFESTAADSAKLSPPSPMRKSETRAYDRHPDIPVRKPSNPRPVPQSSVDTVDMGVFVMDDGEVECRTNEQPIAPRDPSDSPKKTLSGWKISTAPKTDMKSIMAEAETTKTKIYRAPSTPPRTTSQTLGDSSSRNTSEKPLVRTRETSERSATRPLGSSSWRPSPVQYVSTSRTPPKNPMQPSGAKQSPIRQTETSQIHSEKVPSTPSKSMMGPTFVPSKQPISRASSSPTIRRVPSGGSVWSSPLHPTTPVITPPSGTAISFTAIQQLQQEQAIRPTPDKRSLKQIQEEEEAHRAEEEFLKWWAAEEERVRSEQTSLEPSTNSQQRKTKGAKGKAPQRGKASLQKHTAIVQTQGTNVVGAGSTSSTSEYLKRPRGDRPRRRTKDRVNGPVTPASEVQGTQ